MLKSFPFKYYTGGTWGERAREVSQHKEIKDSWSLNAEVKRGDFQIEKKGMAENNG